MGANAQTSVPTFTAGEILTAANMNISARTGIPVFADTSARDAAFGGTGEKTLAEGQYAYIENIAGSAATQYYDGAAWQTLVISGLNLITANTVTSGTTISLDSIFSATYNNYYCVFSNVAHAGVSNTVQFRTGGSTNTTTNYSFGRSYIDVSSTGYDAGSSGTTAITLGANTGSVTQAFEMMITNPFATGETIGWFRQASENTIIASWLGFFLFKATTSFDGLIYTAGSTISSANYAIYGLAK